MTADGTFYYTLTTGHSDVYTATLDPATGKVLVSPERIAPHFEGNALYAPDWSPDGKYLAYARDRAHDIRIMVRDLKTGEERSIISGGGTGVATRGVSGQDTRWSPDGRSLLTTDSRSSGSVISLVSVETGQVSWRTRHVPGVYDRLPQWSPDGKIMVYLRLNTRTNSDHILMQDLETGREKELYEALYINYIALSPDGKELAFWTQVGGGIALQIVPVAGGEPRELIRAGRRVYFPRVLAWTPDGRHLFLAKRNADPDTQFPHELWRMDAGGGEPTSVGLKMEGFLRDVRVHPDGRRIVFTSGRRVSELWAAENFLSGKQSTNE